MRIIARKTLREFWTRARRRDAEQALRAWMAEATVAQWSTPVDIKEQFRSASILKYNRVVFNICGRKYRLVVAVRYDIKIIFIRFVGTHEEYDQINPEVI